MFSSTDSRENQQPQQPDHILSSPPQARAQPLFADCVSDEPVAVQNFSPGASAGPSCRSVPDFDFQCEFCAVPLAFSRSVSSCSGQPPFVRTCRLCQPQAASAASCAGHVQVESAISLAMPEMVGGWFLDCSEVGLGSGAGSRVSPGQDLCCACCFVPLSIRPSWSRPLLPPVCQHCFSARTVSIRPTRRVFLDPYVPSGQPVHKILDFRQCDVLARARPVSESSRILPSLRPDWQCFRQHALPFLSPTPCLSLLSEGPNPNFSLGPKTLLTSFSLGEGPDKCIGCDVNPPLAALGHASATAFISACQEVYLANPCDALCVALRDVSHFCQDCLVKWAIQPAHAATGARSIISGPRYFPLDCDGHASASDMPEPCANRVLQACPFRSLGLSPCRSLAPARPRGQDGCSDADLGRDYFNQSLDGIQLPSSLQSLMFGDDFNQSLEGIQLPSSLHIV